MIVVIIHVLILTINFNIKIEDEKKKENTYFNLVNVKEVSPKIEKKIIEVDRQDKVTEEIIETEKEVKEPEDDYLIPMKGAELPIFPNKKIRSRLIYPEEASEQEIEDYVVLELYISQFGNIDKIIVVRDPGHGFAKAAVKAFERIKCVPAKLDGVPFAVKLRKTIRFVLK